MDKFEIVTGSVALLDRVQDLWQALNNHHVSVSTHFSGAFDKFTFADRKATFIEQLKNGSLLVEIAIDPTSKEDIGYCVTTVNRHNKGEIESIFVKPDYRKAGIGHSLMTRAIAWLTARGVAEKAVAVVYGNEQVFRFYANYGFLPRTTELRQQSDPS